MGSFWPGDMFRIRAETIYLWYVHMASALTLTYRCRALFAGCLYVVDQARI